MFVIASKDSDKKRKIMFLSRKIKNNFVFTCTKQKE